MKLKITAFLLIALLAAACSAPAPKEPGSQSPTLEWRQCQISAQGITLPKSARCTWLKVPENPNDSSGRQIQLNIAVLDSVSKNPAPDPIFFIPGGPGEAATESFVAVSPGFEALWQKREIVLVDQRGTGGSNPLKCSSEEDENADQDQEQVAPAIKTCLDALDADPRFYTTAIAMQDLDRVRAALGYDKINLYGASYGTRAALAYMRQFPERVRSVILDGVAPTNWTLGPSAAGNSQRALDAIFDRCAADPTCSKAFPNLSAEFKAILEKLESAPAEVKIEHPTTGEPTTIEFTRDRFAATIHLMLYTPETAALLPVLIHTAATNDDYRRLAALSITSGSSLESSLSEGMRYSVMCAEDIPYYDQEHFTAGYLGEDVQVFRDICSLWPRGATPKDFHQPVKSDAPVLLISGGADPATPPSNAALAAQTLPNSLQITAPGMGHINLYRGCIPKIVQRFVENGTLTGLDTACVDDITPPPFFLNLNGPTP